MLRVRLELLAQPPDDDPDVVGLVAVARPPDPFEKQAMRHASSGARPPARGGRATRSGSGGPARRARSTRRFGRSMVRSPRTTSGRIRRRAVQRRRTRADPRQQLRYAKRLGQVVVGAKIERLDLLILLVSRGEHQDRHAAPGSDLTEHVHAVDLRAGRDRAGPGRPGGKSRPRAAAVRPRATSTVKPLAASVARRNLTSRASSSTISRRALIAVWTSRQVIGAPDQRRQRQCKRQVIETVVPLPEHALDPDVAALRPDQSPADREARAPGRRSRRGRPGRTARRCGPARCRSGPGRCR